jgi:CRP-like cAMP-binding protein
MSDRGPVPASPEPVEDLLRRVPFFRNLDRVDIARLVGALEKVHLPAGARIFSEGAKADSLYLLEAGRIQVTVRTEDGEPPVA